MADPSMCCLEAMKTDIKYSGADWTNPLVSNVPHMHCKSNCLIVYLVTGIIWCALQEEIAVPLSYNLMLIQ